MIRRLARTLPLEASHGGRERCTIATSVSSGSFPRILGAVLLLVAATPCRAGDATQAFHMSQGPPGQAAVDPRKLEQIRELYDLAQHMRGVASELQDRADDLRDTGKFLFAQREDDKAEALEERAGQIEDQAATLEAEIQEKASGHQGPHRPSAPTGPTSPASSQH